MSINKDHTHHVVFEDAAIDIPPSSNNAARVSDNNNQVEQTKGCCAAVRRWCYRSLLWQHSHVWVKMPTYLQYRIRTDAWYITKYFWQLLFVIFVMAYFQTVWGRTTAFYRHRQIGDYVQDPDTVVEPRLKDIGYEIFPDYSDSNTMHVVNELVQQLTAFWLVTFAFTPYFLDTIVYYCKGGRYRQFNPYDYCPRYTFIITLRFLMCLSVLECFRVATYLSTSIPGPAAHCIGDEERENRPTDYTQAFYQAQVGTNCGDLIFSGHIVLVTLAANFAYYYFPKVFGPNLGRALSVFPMLAVPLQVCLVLMSRSHYSVDLTVGFIVANMGWRLDLFVYRTQDPLPPFNPCPNYNDFYDSNKVFLQQQVSAEAMEQFKEELASLSTMMSVAPSSALMGKLAFDSNGCAFDTPEASVDTARPHSHSRKNSVFGSNGYSVVSSTASSPKSFSGMNGDGLRKGNTNGATDSDETAMSPSEAKIFSSHQATSATSTNPKLVANGSAQSVGVASAGVPAHDVIYTNGDRMQQQSAAGGGGVHPVHIPPAPPSPLSTSPPQVTQ